jgi:dTDP-4-dehydrorhamnose reductase
VNTSGSSLITKPFPYRSIAIFGAGGQLGRALSRSFGVAAVSFDRSKCDFLDPQAIHAALKSERFEWAINTAAYTNVDGAESDAKNCNAINHSAVELLADTCQQSGIRLLQISTDYVFGGPAGRRIPWKESDPTNPEGVYATSKLLGEHAARKCTDHLILRTCGLYDAPSLDGKVRNFCNTILAASEKRNELSIVNDQWCTPTFVPHLVDAVRLLLQSEARGLVHVVNEGATNWFEFGCRLLQLDGKATIVNPISSEQYGAVAKRPAYSVLDTSHYQSLVGETLPHWEDALEAYIRQRRETTVLNK